MIKQFKGSYEWLSNFAKCDIFRDIRKYPSVEHAYQSEKNHSQEWKKFCRETKSPHIVKKQSGKVDLRKDWEFVKLEIMKDCIDQKFNQEPYKSLLIETYIEDIVEGNTWGDCFWGYDLRIEAGENHLGKIIMKKRMHLQLKKYYSVEILRELTDLVFHGKPLNHDILYIISLENGKTSLSYLPHQIVKFGEELVLHPAPAFVYNFRNINSKVINNEVDWNNTMVKLIIDKKE